MSIQSGAFFFDGRTEPELAHRADAAWEGESASAQPLRSASGLLMTWDGRLDNRDDLRRQLGRALDRHVSDAALALAMFERGGVDGLRSLVGDWAMVVWDAVRRTVLLARDYMGVRPLYYCRDARGLRWSTDLGELVVRSNRVDALDDEFAARFMAIRLSSDLTPYADIRGVPPGCAIGITAESETSIRFWRVEPGCIRYRDIRDYDEHLRALWSDAVGARLRSAGTVWAELSGGFDSSSVVCMADALIRDGRVAASGIQPISHVAVNSPEGNERAFIDAVASQVGVPSTIIGIEEHEQRRSPDEWVTPYAPRGIQVASEETVARNGGRVILSGRLGDLVMGCWPDNSAAVFDDFESGRVATALSKVRLWSRATKTPFVAIAAALLRDGVRSHVIEGDMNETQLAGVDLLSASLRPLALEPAVLADWCGPCRRSVRGLAAGVANNCRGARLEARSTSPLVTYAYPFAHRPLVEFVLAIPGEILSAPGTIRALMRRAFKGLVPDRILLRQSKGYYPPAAMRSTRRRLAMLPPVGQFEVVRRGWIDGGRLDAAVRAVRDGAGHNGGGVQRVLLLEEWLAGRKRRAPAAIPNREEVTAHGVLIA